MLLAVAAVAGVLAVVLLAGGDDHDIDRVAGAPAEAQEPADTAAPSPPPEQVSVWVRGGRGGAVVPRRFLGLSFEVASLGQLAQLAARGDLVTLLRSLGPGMLRFGGASADTRVGWTDATTPLPAWAGQALEPRELGWLAGLAARSDWRVLLTLNLVHDEPRAAAREAAAAHAALGRWLAAIEIGNEPDSYGHHHFRSSAWSYAGYYLEVARYDRAIARAAAGPLAVAGPDVSGSHAFPSWGAGAAARQHPALLTGHHYPLGCRAQPPPSVEGLLSEGTRALELESLARYMAVSRAHRIRFRLDEANTVSCGGKPGVSDTFGSALWAVRYIAAAMAAGVSGINLHGNPGYCLGYSPLCATSAEHLAAGILSPQPEWYALLLARRLVGDHALHATVLAPPGANVTATALGAPGSALHVVLVNAAPPGRPAAALTLHVGRALHSARVLALTGPSPQATTGVRLGGTKVASDGSWHEPRLPALPVSDGTVTTSMAPSSAALITVSP